MESSFSSVRGTGANCLRSVLSVQYIQLSSRTLPALTWIDLAGSVRLRLGSVHRISNCAWEEQRSISRSPPAEIPALRSGAYLLGGGAMPFGGSVCLLVRGVVWCRSGAYSVKNRLKRVNSVQFAYLIGSAASSFSSVRETGAKCLGSLHSVQFTNCPGPGSNLTYIDVEHSMLFYT